MHKALHPHHPFRIFFISGVITLLSLAGVAFNMGPQALFIALVLILVEVTFSFDNAIINARVLLTMSPFWQKMFITVGMLIAVFGMRLVFPIVVVMLTSGMAAGDVINLALNQPDKYAHELHDAHVSIASFGGMFLMMLGLHFFLDKNRNVHWIDIVEKPMQRIGNWWVYGAASLAVLLVVAAMPFNPHPQETLVAGVAGIVTYIVVHGLAELFAHKKSEDTKKAVKRAGMAGFMSFLYLEILDASFSFDGVIGAFAVTKDVILIAVGLGIGALWVRSLTIFMVKRQVLAAYRYLEHGAHYTIVMLAIVLLSGIFIDIPEAVAGGLGLCIIAASIMSSVAESKLEKKHGTTHKTTR